MHVGLKIITPKGYAYRKVKADSEEEAIHIFQERMKEVDYISIQPVDKRMKICSCGNIATHKLKHTDWICGTCYGNLSK